MAWLYYDKRFQDHETGPHPESAARLQRIESRLSQGSTWKAFDRPTWQPATDAQLATLHNQEYIARIRQFASEGGGRIEADTMVSAASYQVAALAAGGVCDAVGRVVAAESARSAVCLVRPPGHHARPANAMGFCLFNNVALGALAAIEQLGLERVLVIDWDVHHGNGTQEAFWRDPRVGFFSIHRWPFYPGTGAADETGEGPGLGTTRNLPITFGTSRGEFRQQFHRGIEAFADQIRPDLILLSAGFDAHRLDPIGSLGLETEDFAELTDLVVALARSHCDGKIVSVLEGGYNVDELPGCVETHMARLLAAEEAATD